MSNSLVVLTTLESCEFSLYWVIYALKDQGRPCCYVFLAKGFKLLFFKSIVTLNQKKVTSSLRAWHTFGP